MSGVLAVAVWIWTVWTATVGPPCYSQLACDSGCFDGSGNTAAHCAARNGWTDIVEVQVVLCK